MLTDTQCRTANPTDIPCKLSDGKGLYLEIKLNGVKAWCYRFELREGEATKESTFAIILSDMDTELSALVAWRDKICDLKQAMMQELLTGRTRLV